MRETRSESITGVLLAGGRARRMGGEDKGLLSLAGLPLVARTLARLSPQTDSVVINANRNGEKYAEFGNVVADEIGGFCGPLAGIHAGMRAAKSGEWILSAPCDSPFLPENLAQTLMQTAKDSESDIVIAAAGGRIQPAFMLARAHLAEDLAAFLADGGRKIDLWYPRHRNAFADFADASAFANINTPEELAAAAARF